MLRHAKLKGLKPEWVYDVGVGFGTPWLYEAFPDCKHVLFEPVPAHQEYLQPLIKRLGATLHPVALSNAVGTQTLRIPARTTGSSFMRPSREWLDLGLNQLRGLSDAVQHIDVPTTTLDSVHAGGRAVLKIDVEGSELDVLIGARKTLSEVDLLILEMEIFPLSEDSPSLASKVAFLDELGFQLFDIPALNYPVPGASLGYIDAAFTPKHKPLW